MTSVTNYVDLRTHLEGQQQSLGIPPAMIFRNLGSQAALNKVRQLPPAPLEAMRMKNETHAPSARAHRHSSPPEFHQQKEFGLIC